MDPLNTIIITMLNGEVAHIDKFELMESLKKDKYEKMERKIIETLSTQYPWIRKHRARVIEQEPDCYYFLQDPPNVKKYITERNQNELEISIKELSNSFYETTIDDLIDWLEGDCCIDETKKEKTYEKVIIKDLTSHYFTKLSTLAFYQIGNLLPTVTMTKNYYKNYHVSSISTLFSLISTKLKPSSIEWVGPIIPIELFVEGFPLIKHLTLSFPIQQEDVKKLYSFTQLEEFSSPIPPSVMLEKEYLNLKMSMVEYYFNRRGIEKGVVMGEFLY